MARTWTRDQEDAIRARRGTLLVSAAAGSGKTSVLVERFLERITDEENPSDADRLLVVTYTRAAAEEMRGRIPGGSTVFWSRIPGTCICGASRSCSLTLISAQFTASAQIWCGKIFFGWGLRLISASWKIQN